MKLTPADSAPWNIAKSQHDGKPSFIRYRPDLQDLLGDSHYSQRLVIIWEFEQQNSNGVPTNDQSNEMKTFEDAIIDELDFEGCAILAFAFTKAGVREWHFYIKDINEAGNRINNSLSRLPKFPISLQVEDDPHWDELKNVYSMCGETLP